MEGYFNLLLRQIEKNRQINEFAKRERDAIAAGDIGTVMESDGLRKEVIAHLRLLQSETNTHAVKLAQDFKKLPPRTREQIVTAEKQLRNIISETIAVDRENEKKLKKLREALGKRIEEIKKGKEALSGYKNAPSREPRLFSGAG